MPEVEFVCVICDEVMDAGGVVTEGGKSLAWRWQALNEALDHILKTGHRVELETYGE